MIGSCFFSPCMSAVTSGSNLKRDIYDGVFSRQLSAFLRSCRGFDNLHNSSSRSRLPCKTSCLVGYRVTVVSSYMISCLIQTKYSFLNKILHFLASARTNHFQLNIWWHPPIEQSSTYSGTDQAWDFISDGAASVSGCRASLTTVQKQNFIHWFWWKWIRI